MLLHGAPPKLPYARLCNLLLLVCLLHTLDVLVPWMCLCLCVLPCEAWSDVLSAASTSTRAKLLPAITLCTCMMHEKRDIWHEHDGRHDGARKLTIGLLTSGQMSLWNSLIMSLGWYDWVWMNWIAIRKHACGVQWRDCVECCVSWAVWELGMWRVVIAAKIQGAQVHTEPQSCRVAHRDHVFQQGYAIMPCDHGMSHGIRKLIMHSSKDHVQNHWQGGCWIGKACSNCNHPCHAYAVAVAFAGAWPTFDLTHLWRCFRIPHSTFYRLAAVTDWFSVQFTHVQSSSHTVQPLQRHAVHEHAAAVDRCNLGFGGLVHQELALELDI